LRRGKGIGSREQATGNREQGTGNRHNPPRPPGTPPKRGREQGTGNRGKPTSTPRSTPRSLALPGNASGEALPPVLIYPREKTHVVISDSTLR